MPRYQVEVQWISKGFIQLDADPDDLFELISETELPYDDPCIDDIEILSIEKIDYDID